MQARILCSFALLFILLSAARLKAASVTFAHPDPPRGQQWELLAVRVAVPAGGGTVSVRDARGDWRYRGHWRRGAEMRRRGWRR